MESIVPQQRVLEQVYTSSSLGSLFRHSPADLEMVAKTVTSALDIVGKHHRICEKIVREDMFVG